MSDEPTPSDNDTSPPPGDEPSGRTAEAVEAEYRARLSGKDKAHAAEKRDLEARIASLEAQTKQRVETQMDELETLRAKATKLEADLATATQERQAAAIEARRARFPNAAETLGDEHVLSLDEGKLSELESRLAAAAVPGTGGMVLSNTAVRAVGEPRKDLKDMTVAELEAQLVVQGREFRP